METLQTPKYKILSGSTLKLIAIIAMLIDHTAVVFATELKGIIIPVDLLIYGDNRSLYWMMRMVGRVAFPIFCFLISEGFAHTRNKRKYALQLLIFAVISEIPYNLMHGQWLDTSAQNVYCTLFLGLVMIYAFEGIRGNLKKYLVMLAIATVAYFLKADYGLKGVLLVFLIYVLRSWPPAQAILAYPLLNNASIAVTAFIPINLYNGKRGFIKGPVLKFLFYAFYPLHILILVGLRKLVG